NFLPQLVADLVDINGIVSQEDALFLVDGDHQPLFGDLFYGSRFRHGNVNAGLQHGRRHHEDDQQNQHNVDEGSDVDFREPGLRSSVGGGERHQRLTSATAAAELCG